ncbi:hypothetical protein HOLleu_13581 [Holothuria leucospilota]|uniref:RING-type domain-containing protein n=1 Tax=Holothuria leucospilota TaxID=206669 RepID=A0A9Q1CC17_HOLLE|nr:hypothetical protein HOLleu_13581 [Holothuria leucospilota]
MKKRLSAIVETLKMKKSSREDDRDSSSRRKKPELTVQVGWQNCKSERFGHYSQVRAGNGGGVTMIKVKRTITYQELLNKAKELFFPNGDSFKHGPAANYAFHLSNYRGQEILDTNFSIDALQEEGGSRIRVYLMSKLKEQGTPPNSLASSSSSSLFDPELQLFEETVESTSTSTPGNSHVVAQSNLQPSTSSKDESGTPSVSFKKRTMSCGICVDREKDSFLVPCGHTMCAPCAVFFENMEVSSCPYCKASVERVGRLFE